MNMYSEFWQMTRTDNDAQTDRLEALKQEFLDSGNLLEALSELHTGKETARELYRLVANWKESVKDGDNQKQFLTASQAFNSIYAAMEVYAERWAVEQFKTEQANEWPDDEAPYKGEFYERNFRQAA